MRDESGAPIPLYLAYKNIKPFVDKHLGGVHIAPLRYRALTKAVLRGKPVEVVHAKG